jgi:hypothetical protein
MAKSSGGKGRTSVLNSSGMGGKSSSQGSTVSSGSGKSAGGAKGRMSTLNSAGMGAKKNDSAGASATSAFPGGGEKKGRKVTSMGQVPKPRGTLHFDGKGN